MGPLEAGGGVRDQSEELHAAHDHAEHSGAAGGERGDERPREDQESDDGGGGGVGARRARFSQLERTGHARGAAWAVVVRGAERGRIRDAVAAGARALAAGAAPEVSPAVAAGDGGVELPSLGPEPA